MFAIVIQIRLNLSKSNYSQISVCKNQQQANQLQNC